MHENRSRFSGSHGKVHDLATEPGRVSWHLFFRLGGNSRIGQSSPLASFSQLLYQASHCGHLRLPSRSLMHWDEGLKAQMPFYCLSQVLLGTSHPLQPFPELCLRAVEVTAWKWLAEIYYKMSFSILEGPILSPED